MTRIVVIVGPTACGKSALAVELASRAGAEVVSADSMQVYRGMDVGTAKPRLSERSGIAHHMIDVADPDDPFDVHRYIAGADAAIGDIDRRGKPVIVVGGTGLYIRVLLRGLVDAPPAHPDVRRRIRELADREGTAAVHRRLTEVDAEAARRISPNDLVRMERALETAEHGLVLSELQRRHSFSEARYDALVIGLELSTAELRGRIDARSRAMFEAGMVAETQRLLDKYGPELRALGAVGYRQVTRMLAEGLAEPETVLAVAAATRRYAKRQRTWFRSEPGVQWCPPDDVPWNRLLTYLFK